MNSKNYSIVLILFTLVVAGMIACSKMDDYKKYVQGGEISYTGKLDSLKIFSGRDRVLVTGLFISDPKVKSCRIYWDSRKDSVTVPVTRTQKADTLKQMITGLSEGVHTFEIVTFDGLANPSVIVYGTGTVYGSRYQESLINRPVIGAELDDNANTTIEWGGMDRTSGVFASEITYTKTDDTQGAVAVPFDSVKTLLKNFKYGGTFSYRTKFLPDTLSIDTFYSQPLVVDVKTNVTSQYLLNAGKPFTASSMASGNRWGILANWTTNTAVKNFTGGFGGFENRGGTGVMSMEAGWSTTTMLSFSNGKIFQTVNLPAGYYTFEAVVSDASSSGPTLYVVANEGTDLPNVANVPSTAIAYSAFLGAGTKKIDFTLTAPKTVSLGFAGTLTGTGSNGQYFKATAVKLKYLKL
jgi:hypothetical protein